MGRYCLRYKTVDLRLGARELVVGREHDCDLVLEDSLVSRKHASFAVGHDGVTVRDLESRNGVSINGKRVDKSARANHGDRITIGSQELLLKDIDRTRPVGGTAELLACKACGSYVPTSADTCSDCGVKIERAPSIPPEDVPPLSLKPKFTSSRPPSSLAVLVQLADKALGMGRNDEAERILGSALHALITRSGAVGPHDRDTVDLASGYALRLADALEKASWVDFHFELFTTASLLMSAETIDTLYRVTDKLRYNNPRPLRSYMHRMRTDTSGLGPSERFLLQRLEGLERRIVSG